MRALTQIVLLYKKDDLDSMSSPPVLLLFWIPLFLSFLPSFFHSLSFFFFSQQSLLLFVGYASVGWSFDEKQTRAEQNNNHDVIHNQWSHCFYEIIQVFFENLLYTMILLGAETPQIWRWCVSLRIRNVHKQL